MWLSRGACGAAAFARARAFQIGEIALAFMTDACDILIVGGGAAGLAAARELGAAGSNVLVLEARERIGGRIYTHFDPGSTLPIELGAEFVHGMPPETLDLAKRFSLTINELPGRHWYFRDGVLSKSNEFWSKIEATLSEMEDEHGPDRSFADFIDQFSREHQLADVKPMASLYVEGFHAAHSDDVSVLGLNKANKAVLPGLSVRVGNAAWDERHKIAGFDGAMYPLPPWQPAAGFTLDKALVYGFMRQESAFNPRCRARGEVESRSCQCDRAERGRDQGSAVAGDVAAWPTAKR